MARSSRNGAAWRIAGLAALAALCWATDFALPRTARGEQVLLQDGRTLDGIARLGQRPGGQPGWQLGERGPREQNSRVDRQQLTANLRPALAGAKVLPEKPLLNLQKITIKQQVAPPNAIASG